MAVKILAVDDSAVMRQIMTMTFAGEDAEVVTAESGDEAITKAKSFRPDVVFADASMNGKDGYAVASAIKSDAQSGNPAVIIMASQHTPYDEGKGSAAGVDDHVAKPFDTQAIIDKVAAVLAAPRKSAAAAPPVAAQAAPAAPTGGPVQAGAGGSPRALKRTMAFGSPAKPPRPPAPPRPPSKPQLEVAELEPVEDEPIIELSNPLTTPAQPAPKAAPKPAPAKAPAKPTPAGAPAAAATATNSDFAAKLDGLGLTKDQVEGVLALSRDVVEQVVWEVVPDLAETLIREELKRLTSE